MLNQQILREGLSIMASCRKQTGDIWQAHFGAAAIGSYFFVKDLGADQELAQLVFAQSGEMVKKYMREDEEDRHPACDEQTAVSAILGALEHTIGGLHWVGHNVIYSAASLLAIRELQGWGSQTDITGIADLIRAFEKTPPGRSWIGFTAAEVKRMELSEDDGFPVIAKPEELSLLVLEELSQFTAIYRAESHHDLIGHMLTFSHALNILFDLGHVTFFERGLRPVLKLVKVLRSSRSLTIDEPLKLSSAVDRLPLHPAIPVKELPTEAAFWKKDYSDHDWDFGHIFKFAHSFYDHLRRVEEKRESYIENFRCIIAQYQK
ncbi:hypothetical protein D3P08_22395 [Paenibacillus nanensis]|uniref:Uncharacterized protein n=1 Tax=Paenibacillus nanensis TaxID=393251 RepID=A0A3A1UXG8_9BACL|nr:hypothetical protein [Paenibacillus nanensis]RIX50020.1 hypothetical protein D3P08_22395 [Paenibacillus nanensis]